MKTEKEFSDSFVESCQPSPESAAFVNAVSTHYWTDLTAHLTGHFSYADRVRITEHAARLLKTQLESCRPEEAWKNVIRDFVSNNHWGHSPTRHRAEVGKTEDQKIFWKLFKYGWAFFQSMIILKIAVYYFGLESADNPGRTNVLWVWFFFSLSAGSLAFFAYRNRNDKD